jgi:RNA polymerase sigma factor for flagellar operon FliA
VTNNAPRHQPLTEEQQALVAATRHLVEPTAHQVLAMYDRALSLAELISLGNTGLVEAAQTWNPDVGVAFERFAGFRVEGAMLDGIRKEATFYIGMRISARAASCNFLASQRDTSDPFNDTDEDCTRRLRAFSDGLLASMFAQMLNDVRNERNEPEAERLGAYAHAMNALDAATAGLPERERKLIDLHYRERRDLKEVAKLLSVSYATVRRYHTSVMERLATRLRAHGVTQSPPIVDAP